MKEKTGSDIFLEYAPAFSIWYKVLLMYLFQIIIFIGIMVFFWHISSSYLFGAIVGQFIVAFCGTLPYRYMTMNSGKIREKYLSKYGKLAGQSLWFRFQSYTVPILGASFYFPLLLKTDYFLPSIVSLPPHFITTSLFSWFIALPLGILIVIFGILIRRPSGGFGPDVESYIYLIYPEKGKLITGGIYQYIRSPRYLSRAVISVGFGILANNILAVLVGLIHFIAFSSLIPSEDEELIQRFGNDAKIYQKNVPILFPRYGNWKSFLRFIFVGESK